MNAKVIASTIVSYEQCARAICRRWFRDCRAIAAAPNTWCPYCQGRARDAFVNRVCRNSPTRRAQADRIRATLRRDGETSTNSIRVGTDRSEILVDLNARQEG